MTTDEPAKRRPALADVDLWMDRILEMWDGESDSDWTHIQMPTKDFRAIIRKTKLAISQKDSLTALERLKAKVDLKWEGDYVRGTYITFIRKGMSESGKTQRWEIIGQDEESLGWIKWFGRWRTYAFDAEENTVYEKTCLREIAQFCEELTKQHRISSKREIDAELKATETTGTQVRKG